MIQSGAKVTVEETEAGTVISIFPEPKPWQVVVLSIWLMLWVFSGILGFVGGLKEMGADDFTFLLVFMGFWAYFTFYSVRSLVWLRVGAEFIRISEDTVDYKRSWNGFGRVKSYDIDTIKNLGVVNYEDKKFAKTYNDAFWTVGGEMIGFEYIGTKVAFGFKLSETQAKDIVKRIQRASKR